MGRVSPMSNLVRIICCFRDGLLDDDQLYSKGCYTKNFDDYYIRLALETYLLDLKTHCVQHMSLDYKYEFMLCTMNL